MESETDKIVYLHIVNFPNLHSDNLLEWLWNLETALRIGQVWDPIFAPDSRGFRPIPPNEDDPSYEDYRALASKTCVWIMLAARYEHSHIVKYFAHNNDPVGMYNAIVETYAPSTLANRFMWYKRMRECQEELRKNQDTARRMQNILDIMNLISPYKETSQEYFDELAMFAILDTVHPQSRLFLQLIVDDGATFESVKAAILEAEACYPHLLLPPPIAILPGNNQANGMYKKSRK